MNTVTQDIGAFITRVALGAVLVAHSLYLKLVVYGLPGTAQFFESIGLPAVSAYVVFLVEAISGLALIAGYRTRLAATVVVPILLGATWAHSTYGWVFSNEGGGWEYPLFLAVIALAQTFPGAGALNPSKSARQSEHQHADSHRTCHVTSS